MKLENFDKIRQIVARIKKSSQAVENLQNYLNSRPNGDSDGSGSSEEKRLYNLYLFEYVDGSGPHQADLSGCLVGTAVLKFTIAELKKQIEKDKKELEAL